MYLLNVFKLKFRSTFSTKVGDGYTSVLPTKRTPQPAQPYKVAAGDLTLVGLSGG